MTKKTASTHNVVQVKKDFAARISAIHQKTKIPKRELCDQIVERGLPIVEDKYKNFCN